MHFGKGLTPLALTIRLPLAFAGAAQLGHGHGFVELGNRAEHLAYQLCRRGVVLEGVRTVGCNEGDAPLSQPRVSHLLHHEIAGEAVGGLNDDGANTTALDALEHGGEARPRATRALNGPAMSSAL